MILEKEYVVERDDYANVGNVASNIKQTLQSLGIKTDIIRRVAIASYEAEVNLIIHAWGGVVKMWIDDNMLYLDFKDPGPGIEDLEKAMTPGYSTANEKARNLGFGAGMGLVNIKRVSDKFNLESNSDGTDLLIGFKLS